MSIIQSLTKTASLVKLGALSAALCLSFSNSYAHDGEKKASLGFKTTKLSSDIYVISGVGGFTGGNIGLVVGKEGSVMIDNGVAAVSDLLRSEIRKTTQQPIDYLINTHLHGDHIGNNTQYSNEGAKIISHQNLRASLKKKNDQGLALPVMTFSDQMTLHINNESAKIIHIKDAHTDGDAIIHFENANIIHTGDLMFNGLFPFIDANNGGTLAGVINGLSLIASLSDEETQIIPGHGPMASKFARIG